MLALFSECSFETPRFFFDPSDLTTDDLNMSLGKFKICINMNKFDKFEHLYARKSQN